VSNITQNKVLKNIFYGYIKFELHLLEMTKSQTAKEILICYQKRLTYGPSAGISDNHTGVFETLNEHGEGLIYQYLQLVWVRAFQNGA